MVSIYEYRVIMRKTKIKNICKIQSRNLNNIFRTKEIRQILENILLITIFKKIINKLFTVKQSVQTRVSEQKKIETVNKK